MSRNQIQAYKGEVCFFNQKEITRGSMFYSPLNHHQDNISAWNST